MNMIDARRAGTRRYRLVPLLVLALSAAALCQASEEPAKTEVEQDQPEAEETAPAKKTGIFTFDLDGKRTLVVIPSSDLYPGYVADPRRATFSLALTGFLDSEIPEAGDFRWNVRLGGRYGILRLHPDDEPERGFQLDIEAGFIGHFDIDNSLDNIGWDGVYGLLGSWRPGRRTAYRFGVLHDSSHVGDEYSARTGRERVGYTREEYAGGVSRLFGKSWRAYVEGGWAYERGNETIQDRWRGQFGAEYDGKRKFWNQRVSWYAAIDNAATEERDWRIRSTVQLGVLLPAQRGVRRLGIEVFHGPSALGEFFFRDEAYIAVGWWFDT